jgi:dTDP-4-amino-4,6-dideoxygalactose transaminase
MYKGRMVGSIGHVGAWSFCQDKIMTTGGEGGMVTTNDENLWKSMWSFKDHGKSFDAVYEKNHPVGFRWLHESIGTNWRMIEMQAAIGRIQLKKMQDWTTRRNKNAQILTSALTSIDLVRVPSLICSSCIDATSCQAINGAACVNAWYKFYAYLRPEKLSSMWNREKIIEEIAKAGIPCGSGSCSEIYLEKAFDQLTCRPTERLPNAKELGETSIVFLVHPTIDTNEMERSTKVISEILHRASTLE